MNTVAFHTLGCKVNQYDTQAMLELFRAAGYAVVPFSENADVYVVNTCTVTGTGDKKSMQLTRRLRREHPESEIVLCGCLAQRKGAELLLVARGDDVIASPVWHKAKMFSRLVLRCPSCELHELREVGVGDGPLLSDGAPQLP